MAPTNGSTPATSRSASVRLSAHRRATITGGAVGLIAAGMVHARQLERFELQSVISVPLLDRDFFSGHAGMANADPGSARVGLVRLKGRFTVASSRQLVDVIAADIKGHDVVIFDFPGTTYLDDGASRRRSHRAGRRAADLQLWSELSGPERPHSDLRAGTAVAQRGDYAGSRAEHGRMPARRRARRVGPSCHPEPDLRTQGQGCRYRCAR